MTARGDLVRRCRALETAFRRLKAQGRNTDVGIIWAQQWAMALLDTRTPAAMYANWIEQQEERVLRLVRDSLGVNA
jgi:hypothetical protein